MKVKWKKEFDRIKKLESKGRVRKRDLLRDSFIDEGYAELEGNDTLYVYGNAYEIVLSNSDFHPIIKKVSGLHKAQEGWWVISPLDIFPVLSV